MLSYQEFTVIERQSIIRALEVQRGKIDKLINAVGNHREFILTPAEARRLADLIRPYYVPLAHRIENHPGYEPE